MNIKSLLIGSAAALVAVSGARAADAIVAAEPEAVEYVRVCDAFGTGYFYIPGTETCLKIGGYVRVTNTYRDNSFSNTAGLAAASGVALAPVDNDSFAQATVAYLSLAAKSDTEYGTLVGSIAFQADGAGKMAYLDYAFLSLGNFQIGEFYHWNDRGITGEIDSLPGGTARFNSVKYEVNDGSFRYGISLDQQGGAWSSSTSTADGVGISAIIGGTFGSVTADLVPYYDTVSDNWGVALNSSAAFGPGSFALKAFYNNGANAYVTGTDNGFGSSVATDDFMYAEWLVAASYRYKATDKLNVTLGAQYTSFNINEDLNATTLALGNVSAGDMWKVGVDLDYAITDGLAFRAIANYESFDGDAVIGNAQRDTFVGYLRLQRSF